MIKRNLELLYTGWAVRHLALIEECISKLGAEHNVNLVDICQVMQTEKEKLIQTNPAYEKAWEILESIRHIDFPRDSEVDI